MPRVQNYGPRRVETNPLPGVRRQAAETFESLGGGIAQAQAQLGGVGVNIGTSLFARQDAEHRRQAEDARRRADQIAVLEADNKLASWENTRLYDPQKGALNTRGKDAAGLPETVGTEYDTVAGEISTTLTTPEQRDAFQRARLLRRQHIDEALMRHVSTEIERFDAEETTKGIDNSRSLAIANAANPARVSLELARQDAAVKDYAKAHGLGPEATAARLDEERTKTHVGVLDQLLATDQDRAAQVYFEETKGQISGEAQAKIVRALAEGSLRGESQRKTDAILAGAKTETDALDQAKAIENPELRDAVTQRVSQEWARKKQADRDAHEQGMVQAANLIDQKGSVRAVPPSLWVTLTTNEREELERYAKRNQGEAGVKTDFGTYYELMTLASNDATKATFAKTNLMLYRSKLGNTEFKQLTEAQASIRNGKHDDASKLLASAKNQGDIADEALTQMFGDVSAPALREDALLRDRVTSFRRAQREAVNSVEARTGKPATDADVQSITDTLTARAGDRKTGTFSSTPAFAFEVAQAQLSKATDVPIAERRRIEAALRRANRPVTDAAVLALFNANLQRVRGDR